MNVVVLAGGKGTRLGDHGEGPKPMVTIGGKPILWHILESFRRSGFRSFVVALGHQGDVIRRYFEQEAPDLPECELFLRDTGENTMTGGRLLRLRALLERKPFLLTYGDGVANVDLQALLRHHRECECSATVTAVRPPSRFGCLTFSEDGQRVSSFDEKPMGGEGWIHGGFMVVEPRVLDRLHADSDIFEHTLSLLASEGELAAYQHRGYWQCMDTPRDRHVLEEVWRASDGQPPWFDQP